MSLGYGNAVGIFAVPIASTSPPAASWSGRGPWFGDDPVLAMLDRPHRTGSELVALVSRLNEVHEASQLTISTLAEYLAAAPEPLTPDDPCWRGEMRSGARAKPAHGRHERADRHQARGGPRRALLERYAEPLSALHRRAGDSPEAYLRLAWPRVIENSAHDSICGVQHRSWWSTRCWSASPRPSRSPRRSRARAAAAVAATSARLAGRHEAPRRPPGRASSRRNCRSPKAWSSVALELPRTGAASQPRSWPGASRSCSTSRSAAATSMISSGASMDARCSTVSGMAYRIEGRTLILEVAETSRIPSGWTSTACAATLESAEGGAGRRLAGSDRRPARAERWSRRPAPALGWTALRPVEGGAHPGPRREADRRRPRPRERPRHRHGRRRRHAPPRDHRRRRERGRRPHRGRRRLRRLLQLRPAGDGHDRRRAGLDLTRARSRRAGPGRLVVDPPLRMARRPASDGSSRTAETEATDVVTDVELRADEPFVRVGLSSSTTRTTTACASTLPLPRPAARSHAEGQFAVVERGMTAEGGYREEPLPTFPAHGWVDAGGLRHPPRPRGRVRAGRRDGRELAITVLRSTGLISRNDRLAYGRIRPVPRSPFPMRSSAVAGGSSSAAGRTAANGPPGASPRPPSAIAISSCRGRALAGADEPRGRLAAPATMRSVSEGEHVVLTSLRRRDDDWLEARIVNLDADARSLASSRRPDRRARGGPAWRSLAPRWSSRPDGSLALSLGPAEIRTVQLRRREHCCATAPIFSTTQDRARAPRLGVGLPTRP